jgi:salicylate hydroxylase
VTTQHVLIVGAGVGGLSSALFLARLGCRVTLLEQAAELAEAGAGIQLGANAMKVLRALNLRDAVLARACEPQAVVVRSVHTGRSIHRMLLGAAAAQRYGETYCTLHRADLQAVLLQAVRAQPLIDLRLNAALHSFEQSGSSVQVALQSDEPVQANALIGADGLWSRVRTQLLNDGAPRANGHAAFRALLPVAQVPAAFRQSEVGVWWGQNVHVVSYPVCSGEFWNLVVLTETPSADNHADTPTWSMAASSTPVQQALHNCCVPLRDLIDAVPSTPGWRRWNLFARPSSSQWVFARPSSSQWGQGVVTLLGDAAHPMLPYLAQGAAMALEDAAVLARCVNQHGVNARALRHYETQRTARTARVVNTAQRNGKIFHLQGPARVLRDALLALKGTEVIGLPWLYGADVTAITNV